MDFSCVEFSRSISLDSKEVDFETKKEIIFVGRSNVGKSSIMNAIFGKKDLVKTSSKPGKTKLANSFLVDNKYYFTDLPGYGFAKVSKQMQEELDGLISWYVEEKSYHIQKAVILIDAKIGPKQKDIDMYNYIIGLGIDSLIVLSKIDRISNNEQAKAFQAAKVAFPESDILSVSSLKKTNIKELVKYLKSCLISKS